MTSRKLKALQDVVPYDSLDEPADYEVLLYVQKRRRLLSAEERIGLPFDSLDKFGPRSHWVTMKTDEPSCYDELDFNTN